MNKFFKTAGLVLIGLFFVFSAQAADIISPNLGDKNVTVGTNEPHKNLYTAGANVTINGDTMGDLVVAGGLVTVEGKVEQELLAAGGTLNLNGSVGSHARVAGGNITVSGPVGGDLVVAGGNINITGKSSVGGDLVLGGGNINIDAPVKGSVRIAGGNVTINSPVGGNVYVQASQNLTFGSQADITGTVYYKGPKPATISNGAKVANISFAQQEAHSYRKELVGIFTLAFLVKMFAWIIFGLLLVRFRPGYLANIVSQIKIQPWQSLGMGLVWLIVIPIVVILLLIAIVGYYLGAVLGLAYALMVAVAMVVAALTLGYLILGWLTKPQDGIVDWQAVVIGVVVWSLLRFIPVLGWIIMAVIFLMVFGSMLKTLRQIFKM